MPQNPYRVEAPDGKIIEFPTSMTQTDIEEAMRKLYGKEGPMGRFLTGAAEASILPMAQAAMNPIEALKGMGQMLTPQGAAQAGLGIGGELRNRIQQGNYAGAAGYGAGTVLPALTGIGAMKGATAAGVPGLLKRAAENQYARVLAPTRGLSSQAAKVAAREVTPGLIERGVMAPTLGRLTAKIGARAENADAALEAAYDALPQDTRVAVRPIWDAMEDFRKRHAKIRGTDIVENEVVNAGMIDAQTKLLGSANEFQTASLESLRDFRGKLDKHLKNAGGFYNKDVAEVSRLYAYKGAADAIRRELAKDFPHIASINKEFNFWQKGREILEATQLRRYGQSVPMGEQLFGAGGMTGGLIKGGIGEGVLTGVGAATAVKLFRSTGYRTLSAVIKDRLADMIASGNVQGATGVLTLMANQVARQAAEKWHRPGMVEEERVP